MMRIVFDTNIVVSGQLWSGAPHKAISIAERKDIQSLASEMMLDELKDVLNREKFDERLTRLGKTAAQVVEQYLSFTEVVEPAVIEPTILQDPDDDAILACAVSGQADAIVTGDPHLLNLQSYKNIPIWTVNEFLERIS